MKNLKVRQQFGHARRHPHHLHRSHPSLRRIITNRKQGRHKRRQSSAALTRIERNIRTLIPLQFLRTTASTTYSVAAIARLISINKTRTAHMSKQTSNIKCDRLRTQTNQHRQCNQWPRRASAIHHTRSTTLTWLYHSISEKETVKSSWYVI